jgi:transcriptional regulator with XRE-family HTH domain
MGASIGAKLRRLREQRGLTQACLAKLSRTTQQHISLLERDAAGVELGTLQKILDALGYRLAFAERPPTEPLAKRLGQWARFEARARALEGGPRPTRLSLAQAGELADFYLARHGRAASSPELWAQARRIRSWRGLLAQVRLPRP